MKPEMVIEAAETLLAGKSQTPADWFKLSLNVLTDSSELKEMLSLEGVNARQATDFSISGLVSQLKAQETNVIHLVSGRKRLNFVLARLLATLVLPMPPVFIIGKPEMTIELILAKYKARFRDRKYL